MVYYFHFILFFWLLIFKKRRGRKAGTSSSSGKRELGSECSVYLSKLVILMILLSTIKHFP